MSLGLVLELAESQRKRFVQGLGWDVRQVTREVRTTVSVCVCVSVSVCIFVEKDYADVLA